MSAPKDQPWPDVPPERRKVMASIRGRDTKPELVVRSLLHRLGYRFRVGKRHFGWRPDVVFPGRRKAIFVHGCFWHGHVPCRLWRPPKTRSVVWEAKLARNRARDARVLSEFEAQGWDTLVLWECELRSSDILAERLTTFLGPCRRPSVAPRARRDPKDLSSQNVSRIVLRSP
jgi:DNA mismatch endonuclease (patch repair protein)